METSGTWPAGVEARPIAEADVVSWAELRAAAEKVDQEGENYDVDDLLEELGDPKLDAEQDTTALWADGSMVGYAAVQWRPNVIDVHRLRTEGTVHPEWRGRGLGAGLVRWMIDRARALHREKHPEVDGEINSLVMSTNIAAQELLASHGFEESRYYFHMLRPLGSAIPDLAAPDGFQVVAFDPSYDLALMHAHNEAFMDHWGSTPKDEETWKVWFTGSRGFRGGVSRLVLHDNKIVAYTLNYEYVADTAATGVREMYIGAVGTLRPYRGQGLARLAMASSMTAARQSGFERASLDVDTANPTGALGLYESLDFTQANKTIGFRLPLGTLTSSG